MKHDPNCAVVRGGDLRAWCDCGAEIPVMNEIRANVSETIGAGKERAKIVAWLREVNHYVAKTLADDIEDGAHNDDSTR